MHMHFQVDSFMGNGRSKTFSVSERSSACDSYNGKSPVFKILCIIVCSDTSYSDQDRSCQQPLFSAENKLHSLLLFSVTKLNTFQATFSSWNTLLITLQHNAPVNNSRPPPASVFDERRSSWIQSGTMCHLLSFFLFSFCRALYLRGEDVVQPAVHSGSGCTVNKVQLRGKAGLEHIWSTQEGKNEIALVSSYFSVPPSPSHRVVAAGGNRTTWVCDLSASDAVHCPFLILYWYLFYGIVFIFGLLLEFLYLLWFFSPFLLCLSCSLPPPL